MLTFFILFCSKSEDIESDVPDFVSGKSFTTTISGVLISTGWKAVVKAAANKGKVQRCQ